MTLQLALLTDTNSPLAASPVVPHCLQLVLVGMLRARQESRQQYQSPTACRAVVLFLLLHTRHTVLVLEFTTEQFLHVQVSGTAAVSPSVHATPRLLPVYPC